MRHAPGAIRIRLHLLFYGNFTRSPPGREDYLQRCKLEQITREKPKIRHENTPSASSGPTRKKMPLAELVVQAILPCRAVGWLIIITTTPDSFSCQGEGINGRNSDSTIKEFEMLRSYIFCLLCLSSVSIFADGDLSKHANQKEIVFEYWGIYDWVDVPLFCLGVEILIWEDGRIAWSDAHSPRYYKTRISAREIQKAHEILLNEYKNQTCNAGNQKTTST